MSVKIERFAGRESQSRFQTRVLRDLDVAEAMIGAGMFSGSSGAYVGVEQEMQFVGADGRPAHIGEELVREVHGADFEREFARFNFEAALPPVRTGPGFLDEVQAALMRDLGVVDAAAAHHDARVVLCGILPSVRLEDIGQDALTDSARYRLLHDVRQEAKGGDVEYQIHGIDDFVLRDSKFLLDGVFTSLQLHWQVAPDSAADEYNWAQLIAAPCLAAACCSPLLFGRRLWHETRVALFQQTSDLRGHSLEATEDQPARATLGHGWIDAIIDVWKEELASYPPHMGCDVEETPEIDLNAGRVPDLSCLQSFNGAIYRWNRLCYGVGPGDGASLRIEGRTLPAGLTRRDQMANAALWWGLMAAGREEGRGLAAAIPFSRVRESFLRTARDGMECEIFWRDGTLRPVHEILLEELLPIASRQLDRLGVRDSDAWLKPIEARARAKQTASRWMLDTFDSLTADYGTDASCVYLTEAIVDLASSDTPVSEWPARGAKAPASAEPVALRPSDTLALALHRLRWERADDMPVRTEAGDVVSVARREIEQAMANGGRTVADALSSVGCTPSDSDSGTSKTIDCFGRPVPLDRVFCRRTADRPGPLLVVLAGLHGNELNGVAALAEFDEHSTPERGEMIGLLGNLRALERNVRFLDHDLNRAFDNDFWREDTPERQEAATLWRLLERLADENPDRECWLVDLHGTSGHTPPYLSAMSDRDAWPIIDDLPIPKATGFERMFRGTLVEYAVRRGWRSATFEIGALADPTSVTNGIDILKLVADAIGVAPLPEDERLRVGDTLRAQSSTHEAYRFVYRHAIEPADEFAMLPDFVSFQALRKDQHVADDRNGKVFAPCAGRIVMPLYQSQGESGFYIVANDIENN
jgi:hypothetical protein